MKVTTITGETLDKELTRKIKSLTGEYKYYKIGVVNIKNSGDCYQINGIFYTIEKERIAWDENLKNYCLKSTMFYGIVDIFYNYGYFSKTNSDFSILFLDKTGISTYCVSKVLALSLGMINGEKNLFYNPTHYTYEQILPRTFVSKDYKYSLPYNLKDCMSEAIENFENFEIVKNNNIEEKYDEIKYFLNTYSFGIELETTSGIIPKEIYKSLGLRPLRDGSISGLEYVTIPLSNKKGFYAFVKIIEVLNKYTSSDYTCSMHIHVGNIPRNKSFIVGMFKTMYYLQENLYNLFPTYKKSNGVIKKQCYTSPLDSHLMTSLNYISNTEEKLNEDFQKIVYELSDKCLDFKKNVELCNILNHPKDPSQNSKWNIKARYKILNLIPLVFTNKETIEYRIFTVPDTIEKAIFFLSLSLAITDFVCRNHTEINNNQKSIQNLNLYNILDSSFFKNLNQYYHLQDRKKKVFEIINYQGGFFEEKNVKLNKNIVNVYNIPDMVSEITITQ